MRSPRRTVPRARRSAAVLAVGLAALLTACSSSKGTGAATTPAGGVTATTLLGAETPAVGGGTTPSTTGAPRATTLADAPAVIASQSGVTGVQASCIVDKLVTAVGKDTALKIVNDDSDITARAPAERKAAADALFGCIDKQDFAKTAAASFYTQFKDLGITQDQADCIGTKLVEVLTPEGLLGLSATAIGDAGMDPDTSAKLLQVITDCVPSGVLGELTGGATTTAATGAVGSSSTSTTKA